MADEQHPARGIDWQHRHGRHKQQVMTDGRPQPADMRRHPHRRHGTPRPHAIARLTRSAAEEDGVMLLWMKPYWVFLRWR
jgi:hypothetical protein